VAAFAGFVALPCAYSLGNLIGADYVREKFEFTSKALGELVYREDETNGDCLIA
jgi:hypothetical protein